MSIKWYPTIDMDRCGDCKVCFNFFTCSVFELANDRVIVAYPEDCTWECTKCEDICPNNNILCQLVYD